MLKQFTRECDEVDAAKLARIPGKPGLTQQEAAVNIIILRFQ